MENHIIDHKNISIIDKKITGSVKILVGGCFDIFHFGHLSFLKKAKEINGALIVALESDDKILNLKNRRPIHTQEQRAEILSSLKMVDFVIKLSNMKSDKDYESLVLAVKPDFVAVTEGDKYIDKKKAHAQLVRAKVIEVSPFISDFSSSRILNLD